MLPRGRTICHALAPSDLVRVTRVVVMVPRRVLARHNLHAPIGGAPGSLMQAPVWMGASLSSRLGVRWVSWAVRRSVQAPLTLTCASFSGGPYMAHLAWANPRPLMGLFPSSAIMYMQVENGSTGRCPGIRVPLMAPSALRRTR